MFIKLCREPKMEMRKEEKLSRLMRLAKISRKIIHHVYYVAAAPA
jgi:hypothetical protein